MVRSHILAGEPRIDGRDPAMIRALDVATGLLPQHTVLRYLPVVKPKRLLQRL